MTDILTRLTDALSDRYQVERELGQGGMATVYLAEDLRHHRKVAIKVLRPELAAVLGADRFLHEITTTAALQHPHILPLFDSGTADSFLYYVMPYVEGETLRNRLDRERQLAVDDAVRIARETADALDYAHRHGVVHRDIKPENILLHDGHVLVADFGIALAVREAGAGRLTETGMSLGTPYYMSPEQAMGDRNIDARSDIYSLGATTYEMLCGEPPFTGPSAQAIVARVVTEDPRSLVSQRRTIPPHVEGAVLRCLEKLPADRWATAAEFSAALAGQVPTVIRSPGGRTQTGPAFSRRPRLAAGLVALALVLGVLGGWLIGARRGPEPEQRFTIVEGDSLTLGTGLDISPDGQTIAFGAFDHDGAPRLYYRRLDQAEPTQVPGAVGYVPRFSPDGQSLAFISPDQKIFRYTLGAPQAEAIPNDSGASLSTVTWSRDGKLYFTDRNGGAARLDPVTGGRTELALPDSVTKRPLLFVTPLPHGRGVIVNTVSASRSSGAQVTELMAIDTRTGTKRTLGQGTSARFVAPGTLLYALPSGELIEQPFDVDRLRFSGPPRTVATGVAIASVVMYAPFGVAQSGTLIYQSGAVAPPTDRFIVRVDLAGRATPLPLPPNRYQSPALSPDGRHLAVQVNEANADGGYILAAALGDSVPTRLTFEGVASYPTFSADGKRVVYSVLSSGGSRHLAWTASVGGGHPAVLMERPGTDLYEAAFSPDGQWMVYRTGNATNLVDLGLRVRRLDGSGDTVFVNDPAVPERSPAFSPDGRWLAYTVTFNGTDEVMVRPFPNDGSDASWQVSQGGGDEPVWGRSGNQLFYKSPSGLMAATIRTAPSFGVVGRRRLFPVAEFNSSGWHTQYAVLPGDTAFVMVKTSLLSSRVETHVVLHWLDGDTSH